MTRKEEWNTIGYAVVREDGLPSCTTLTYSILIVMMSTTLKAVSGLDDEKHCDPFNLSSR